MLKKNAPLRIAAAVLFVLAMTIAARLFSKFTFQINDDFYISRFAAGIETGILEDKLYFCGAVFSKVLWLLYSVSASVPWYSLILEGSLFFVSVFILCKFLKKAEKKWEIATVFFCFGIYWLFFVMPQMISVSFFVVPAALCCAAILHYYSGNGKAGTYIVSLLLLFAAIEIRSSAAVMAIPFAGAAFLGKVLPVIREKRAVIANLCFAMACGFVFIMNANMRNMAFGSPEWEEYSVYSNARGALFDYCSLPDYDEETKEIYESVGISESGWKILTKDNHLTFNTEFDADTMQILRNTFGDTMKIAKPSLPECFLTAAGRKVKEVPTLSGLIVLVYGWLLYGAVRNREQRKRRLAELASVYAVSLLAWMVCVYRGKLPMRISVSLYYFELSLLLGLVLTHFGQQREEKEEKRKRLAFCLGSICIALFFGKSYLEMNRACNATMLNGVSAAYQELEAYMGVHQDNFYYMDVTIAFDLTGEIFAEQEISVNQALMGGWLPRTPYYHEKYEQYGLGGVKEDLLKPNVFLVFKGEDAEAKERLLTYLYEQDTRMVFETKDIVKTEVGTVFEIVGIADGN